MSKPEVELLMPAGSLEKLQYAFAYGADAVYAGVPLFSLRARENEFTLEDLKTGYALAREQGKKVYLTANVFARNVKINAFRKNLDLWAELKPDAMIMSDPGLISMVREAHPQIPVHLSVQANCMNWQAVKFWHETLGVERVILSRELRLEEVKEIKQRVPGVELEAFVHGSICIAYSGRCLLSHYMSYRDANQGVCDNSCRYNYKVYEAKPKDAQSDYYIEDLRNQGEFYRIDEDENGTYIMNAKDLRLIEYLREIIDAGVCSLKIEGRTKSLYYVAMVTRAYRRAIDDAISGKPFDPELLTELDKVANRGYHPGFMVSQINKDMQNYDTGVSRNFTQKFAGVVQGGPGILDGYFPVEIRNRLEKGAVCEIIGPEGTTDAQIGAMIDPKGNVVEVAHGGTGVFQVQMNKKPAPFSFLSLKLDAAH